jgi:hypothetical protein
VGKKVYLKLKKSYSLKSMFTSLTEDYMIVWQEIITLYSNLLFVSTVGISNKTVEWFIQSAKQ